MTATEKRTRIRQLADKLSDAPSDGARRLAIEAVKLTLNGNSPNSWTILRHGVVLFCLEAGKPPRKGSYYRLVADHASLLLGERISRDMCKTVARRIV